MKVERPAVRVMKKETKRKRERGGLREGHGAMEGDA